MFGLGPAEMLVLLLLSAGSSTPDAVSLLPARDYFKMRSLETTPAKLLDLASQDPTTPKLQIQQLMALRLLAETLKIEPAGLKVIRDIADGNRAQDKTGFAQKYAKRVLDAVAGKGEGPPPKVKATEGLEWFPADAAITGVVDFRLARIPGLRRGPTEPAIWNVLPEKAKRKVLEKAFEILESTGNVEVYRGAFALAEGKRGLEEDPRIYIRFTGKFNREWLVATLKKLTPLTIESGKGPGGESFDYAHIERGELLLAFLGDDEFLLAGAPGRDEVKAMSLLQAMLEVKGKKKDSVLKGMRTKDLLAKVPPSALGMVVMDLSIHKLGLFPFFFGPVPQPDKIVLFAGPALKALDIQMELLMKNEGDARDLTKAVSNLREEGIRELKRQDGKGGIPGFSTQPFIQLLESLQVETKGTSTHVRLLVSEELVRNMVEMMLRIVPRDLEP